MISFKQALNHFRLHAAASLLLGIFGALLILAAQYIPIAGPIALCLSLLLTQLFTQTWIDEKKWPRNFEFAKSFTSAALIGSIILTPTGILLGSAHGMLHSPQQLWQTLPSSVGIFALGCFFYLIVAHSLMNSKKMGGMIKALDLCVVRDLKNLREVGILCLWMALIFTASQYLWGVGLIVALPLLLFSAVFSKPT